MGKVLEVEGQGEGDCRRVLKQRWWDVAVGVMVVLGLALALGLGLVLAGVGIEADGDVLEVERRRAFVAGSAVAFLALVVDVSAGMVVPLPPSAKSELGLDPCLDPDIIVHGSAVEVLTSKFICTCAPAEPEVPEG